MPFQVGDKVKPSATSQEYGGPLYGIVKKGPYEGANGLTVYDIAVHGFIYNGETYTIREEHLQKAD